MSARPPLNGLHIEGKLSFADNKDLELTTEWIMVHGELDVGSEAKPFTHKATITPHRQREVGTSCCRVER